jgi:pyruvate formate lyase activating enzyme
MNPLSSASDLRVRGLARLSTCDWPGQLAATLFCQGCAWTCTYCHNPHLQPAHADEHIDWADLFAFLESRRSLLDAVVFSGGEPLLQPALHEAIQAVKDLGFRIGLHTSGMFHERFQAVLPLLDWVGFDVKAPWASYAALTGSPSSAAQTLKSLQMLLASGTACEVRTTLHPSLLSPAELLQLRDELLSLGVTHYAVQRYRDAGVRPGQLPPVNEHQFSLPSDFGAAFRCFTLR